MADDRGPAADDPPPRNPTAEEPKRLPDAPEPAPADADAVGRAPGSVADDAEQPTAAGGPDPTPRAESRILRIWASAELAVGSLAVVVIFVSVLWQVVSRYAPALNWPGVSELGNYSLIVLTFIMVGYLIGNNGHITIQIIDYLAKGRAMVVVRAVSAGITALICALLVWEAVELIQAYPGRRTAALGIPIWLLYTVPLVGFASGVVRAVVRIFTADREDVVFDAAEAR